MKSQIIKFFLKHYENKDYVIRQKATVMLVFCGVVLLLSITLIFLDLFVIKTPFFINIIICSACICLTFFGYLLRQGYHIVGSHCIMLVSFTAIWATLFGDTDSGYVEHLDTIVMIMAALAMTPIAVSENKYGILFYYIVNILIFLGFIGFIKTFLEYPDDIVIEYAIDNLIVFLLLTAVSYKIFNINKVALNNARESEESLRLERDTLDMRVQKRTNDLNLTLEKVEEANSHILSSLRYARKIQLAILPGREQVDRIIKDYFIIWTPRDVVGGDFYYIDKLKGITIIAVADCTGHGVPGAFMTMVASSELRRIVREEKCFSPDEILHRLNTRINQSLRQGNGESSLSDEGLDIGVCVIVKSMNELMFAGAKMPLYYFSEERLEVIKGDRYSVGYVTKKGDVRYTTHRIKLHEGMKFYMATDGFTDQPGEGKRRRFSTSRFKQLLIDSHKLDFDQQQLAFLVEHDRFRGNRAAVDDITVVGFSPDPPVPISENPA